MNRRAFFNDLAAGLAATSSGLFLPKLIKPVWKRNTWIINPEWENAPMEFHSLRDFYGKWRFVTDEYSLTAPNGNSFVKAEWHLDNLGAPCKFLVRDS